MESQPQNPEFRNNHVNTEKYYYKIVHCYHYDWPMNILEIPYW